MWVSLHTKLAHALGFWWLCLAYYIKVAGLVVWGLPSPARVRVIHPPWKLCKDVQRPAFFWCNSDAGWGSAHVLGTILFLVLKLHRWFATFSGERSTVERKGARKGSEGGRFETRAKNRIKSERLFDLAFQKLDPCLGAIVDAMWAMVERIPLVAWGQSSRLVGDRGLKRKWNFWLLECLWKETTGLPRTLSKDSDRPKHGQMLNYHRRCFRGRSKMFQSKTNCSSWKHQQTSKDWSFQSKGNLTVFFFKRGLYAASNQVAMTVAKIALAVFYGFRAKTSVAGTRFLKGWVQLPTAALGRLDQVAALGRDDLWTFVRPQSLGKNIVRLCFETFIGEMGEVQI